MARLGYVEGGNIVFEARAVGGQLNLLPGYAKELVAMNVDVIATYGGPPTAAARKATQLIPIVAALVADPVAIGAAVTLARPGGNTTGITNHDPLRATRQLALLKEVFPKLTRVAFLSDADIPGADASGFAPIERDNIAAAIAANIRPQTLKLRGPKPDLGAAFDAIRAEKSEVIVVMEVPVSFLMQARIVELAKARAIPTLFWGGTADPGMLMSYGTAFADAVRGMPLAVDKILKGATPQNTPFEEVTRQQLVVNLKVARKLGIIIPPDVLTRADRMIE